MPTDFRSTAGGDGTVLADSFGVGLDVSATINFASIADGDSAAQSVTVAGAAIGDFVLVAPPVDLQGLGMSASVISANTVEIVLVNGTGGAVDLASGEWKVKVLR